MKLSLKKEIITIILLSVTLISSVFFYQHFPAKVATHWNYNGQIDGYSSAGFAAFFFPILIAVIYVVLLALPYIDPRKERYVEFAKPYHVFKTAIIGMLIVIYFLVSFNGLGYNIRIELVIPMLIGVLFIILGNYFGKLRSNYFMGIRTPWTLANEDVWNKTHRLGGKLFVLGGLLMMLMGFVPASIRFPFFIGLIALIAFVPILYSYIAYKRLQQ